MNCRACAAIGFSIAAAIFLAGPYTNYSPPAVDMWFSTGYFTNFTDLVQRYGLTYYYVSRLPYILPGVGIYAVFAPKVANFVLNLASFGTTVTALLIIASRLLDRRWAIALTCLFAFNSYILFANLWDYSDGPAIAYFLAGLAIASMAGDRDALSVRALLGIGACWMCAILTNLIAGVLVLPFAVQLVFSSRSSWNEPARRTAWATVGAIAVFVPLAIVSRVLFGFWFFPAPQIAQLLYTAQSPDYLPRIWGEGYAWIAGAYRLAALYGPVLVALPCLFVARFRTRAFVDTFAVCAAGALIYLVAELSDKVLLKAVYHGTFLLVFSFVQTVALVRAATASASSAKDKLVGPRLLVFLAVAVGFSFLCIDGFGWATWPVLGASIVLFAAAILAPGNFPWRTSTMAVAVALLLNVSAASDREVRWIYVDNKDVYTTALETQSLLMSGVLKGEQIRFWHDRDDPQAPLFLAINSLYLWLYRDLTNDLPKMSAAERDEVLPPGVSLVHLCTGTCPLEKRAALLRDAQIDVVSTYTWQARTASGVSFTIAVQKTSPSALGTPLASVPARRE